MINNKPASPLLCRVVAGLSDNAFRLHRLRMANERARRDGRLGGYPIDPVYAGLDQIGFCVLEEATLRDIKRREISHEEERQHG